MRSSQAEEKIIATGGRPRWRILRIGRKQGLRIGFTKRLFSIFCIPVTSKVLTAARGALRPVGGWIEQAMLR